MSFHQRIFSLPLCSSLSFFLPTCCWSFLLHVLPIAISFFLLFRMSTPVWFLMSLFYHLSLLWCLIKVFPWFFGQRWAFTFAFWRVTMFHSRMPVQVGWFHSLFFSERCSICQNISSQMLSFFHSLYYFIFWYFDLS